jgi:Tc toxin complex TcA C-terminal TcB-binding domain/Neuraminidase-like domain/Salmonella virulence plasmid 28.1kDa A protein
MPARPSSRPADSRFAALIDGDPEFDLLTFDFQDPRQRARLSAGHGQAVEELKAYQRLYRVLPHSDRHGEWAGRDLDGVARALIRAGLTSAHHIAGLAEHQFVRDHANACGGDERLAAEIHRRAVQVRAHIRHVVANLRDVVASRHFRATLAADVDPGLVSLVQEIPGYTELFGSLDYYRCRDCESIFGPAAYFLDLMRITDRYITDPNDGTIPPHFKLRERRPDLFTTKLTCAQTSDLVPTVRLINKILAERVGGSPWQSLATAPYPFELPFNRPLLEIETTLGQSGTRLETVAASMLAPDPSAPGYPSVELARAALGLSPERVLELTTPNTGDAAIGAQYGLDSAASHLPAAGPGTITVGQGEQKATGGDGRLGDLLVPGQRLAVRAEVRTVTSRVSADTVEVDVPWAATATDTPYTIFPVEDLSTVAEFTYRVGGLGFEQLSFLFRQGLSDHEIEAGLADRFFINDTGEAHADGNLRISQDAGGDTANPVARVLGLTPDRLDRLSRFVRLSTWSGVPYDTLDWLLRATSSTEITGDFLVQLASLLQLATTSGLPVEQTAAFAAGMKTSGRGDGPTPVDLFDRVFNSPALLRGADPYTSATPLPFDPGRPLSWPVGAPPGWAASSGTVRDATQDTITLATSAAPDDGAYDGLVVLITGGQGAGQVRAIRAYDGAGRVATLTSGWDPRPDDTSAYTVTAAAGLTDRLAAALQVSKPDLDLLGAYLRDGLGLDPAVPVPLTVEHLTALWRLATVALRQRLTVDEYLTLRRALGLPARPPQSPSAAIADAQAAFAGAAWVAGSRLSVYELQYVLHGTTGRNVQVVPRAQDVPAFVNGLAAAALPTLVQAANFTEAGLSADDGDRIVTELRRLRHIDDRGVILFDRTEFASAAAAFPVTDAELVLPGTVTPEQARAVVAELRAQRPALLTPTPDAAPKSKPKAMDVSLLTVDYQPGEPLEFLFRDEQAPTAKRDRVTSVLDGVAAKILATMYAKLAPVDAATTFVTADIGQPQSGAVFDVLRKLQPPVLLVKDGARTGALSAGYTPGTPLPGLFDSAAAGQGATVTGYDGQTKTARVDPPWQTVPDAFTRYEIRQAADAGQSRDAGPASLQLAETASSQDGAYTGRRLLLTDGADAGSWRTIVGYTGASRTATVDRDWPAVPPPGTGYQVYVVVATGSASRGTTDSIQLAPDAAQSDGAYTGMGIVLVADTQTARKVAQVRTALAGVQATIALIADTIAAAQSAQVALATQSLAGFVSLGAARTLALLPYAGGRYRMVRYLPGLLTPVPGGTAPADIVDLVMGIGRTQLAASRLGLTDLVLGAIARRPDRYAIAQIERLSVADLRRLAAFMSLARASGDDGSGLAGYLDIWTDVVGAAGKQAALAEVTGWPGDQIGVIGQFLADADIGWPGLGTLPGVLRLGPPFTQLSTLAADGAFLTRLAGVAQLPPLGPIASQVAGAEPSQVAAADPATWQAYQDAAEAALALVGARYPEAEFAAVADELGRAVETGCRDALLGYAIWRIQKDVSSIHDPSDLFQYLLIDVKMSGCDTTSPIAQGIEAVQLYMQRARMSLEEGVTTDQIRPSWWEWMSSYRLWEANRKVFVYPENYIDPTLRRSASPEFKALIDELLQRQPTDEAVATAMSAYFDGFETISKLVHVGGYRLAAEERENDQVDETTHLVARTNTTPYRYYTRSFTRSTLLHAAQVDPVAAESVVWQPWRKIDATIDADAVTPVFVFDRLFLLWDETKPTKSSTVLGSVGTEGLAAVASQTQSVWQSTLRGTFLSATGDWVSAQEFLRPASTLIMPNKYAPATDPYVQNAYALDQSYWGRPLAQALSRGLPATGTLTLIEDFDVAKGNGTVLERQVKAGDRIWVAGQLRTVRRVQAGTQQLVVDRAFTVDADAAPFKVLPRDQNTTAFEPFTGPGTVQVSSDINVVTGTGTRFQRDLAPGDSIQVADETRSVASVFDDTRLTVDREWARSTTGPGDDYVVIPRNIGAEQLLVMYGANLDLAAPLPNPTDDGRIPNPNDDPFIASTNAFNANLYGSLVLARQVKSRFGAGVVGDVAAQPAILLGNALDKRTVRSFARGYQAGQATTSGYVRAALDRENRILFARPERRPLIAGYWGDSTPGTTHNQVSVVPGDRPLLYHVSPDQSSVFGIGNQFGWFLLNDTDQSFLITVDDPRLVDTASATFVRPLWQPGAVPNVAIEFGPYTTGNKTFDQMLFRASRLTTGVGQTLQQRLHAGGFDTLLSLSSQSLPEPPFSQFYKVPTGAPPPAIDAAFIPPAVMDFDGSFGGYFWEIFFHAPLLVASQLKLNQNFAAAKRWYEYIFNPNAGPGDGDGDRPNSRYWRFRPFRERMTIPGLREILTNNTEITTYNDDPFDPDAIARLRISAYAKATFMSYVDNLILWGDRYFAQDTRESITQATSLYVLASDLLGKRPELVGEFKQPPARNFDQIKAAYPDGIPQFLIELENSSFAPLTGEGARYADVPFNDIDAYFCVPENGELIAFWDRVDDRLFKIRHCQNIDGVERPLALFAPPIDVRSLLQRRGAAGQIGVTASGAPYPIPNLRFAYLIDQARNAAENAIRLGGALLAALERKDGEALARLQVAQQTQVLSLSTVLRQQQIEATVQQRTALEMGRSSALARQTHYRELIAQGLLPEEIAQIALLITAGTLSAVTTVLRTAAAIGFAVPQVGSPFAMTYGGQQIGSNLQSAAAAVDSGGGMLQVLSYVLSLFANQARRVQDWTLQETLAGFDVAQLDAQLAGVDIQRQIAEGELRVLLAQIAQGQALEEFYRDKFTNEELYQWMAGRLAAAYFQTYTIALELARMAERAFQFEWRTQTSFVSGGDWADLRRGLTAGEGLMLSLDQLAAAQSRITVRRLEITKSISLARLDPIAFLSFIRTGVARFELDERLFDLDFPGHYQRRIKTLAVSIPALVGPYQNIHATLTQTANRQVLTPSLRAVQFLLGEDVTVPDGVLEHNVRVNQRIVLSAGQGDTGLFEVALDDPLYLPFEGTGAVSSWTLSMPARSNPVDFGSISDVVLQLRYTALDGGDSFQRDVADLVRERTWTSLVQAARLEPAAWHAFLHGPVLDESERLSLRLAGLDVPNVATAGVTGLAFRLVVPPGVVTSAREPYIAVTVGTADPVWFAPGDDGGYVIGFERPVGLPAGPLGVTVDFDLRAGRAPADLRTHDGTRLSPAAVLDIEVVLFLHGTVR